MKKILLIGGILCVALIAIAVIIFMPDKTKVIADPPDKTKTIAVEPSENFLHDVQPDGTIILYEYKGDSVTVKIPSEIDGKKVTVISDGSFSHCETVERVIIPDTITNISSSAFAHCKKLSEISLPKSIEFIGSEAFLDTAFYNDWSNWEDGVLYIDDCLIAGYPATENNKKAVSGVYNIKEGTRVISQGAFMNCRELTQVTVPDSIKELDDSIFSGASKLEKITLPENLTYIGFNVLEGTAFYNDLSNWENGVLYIDDYLMSGVYAVYTEEDGRQVKSAASGKFTLKDGTRLISAGAFEPCAELTEVIIPSSVETICNWAFSRCPKLKYVEIPATVTDIGSSAFGYYFDPDFEDFTISPDFIVIGEVGSAAEKYAKEHGVKFYEKGNVPSDITAD